MPRRFRKKVIYHNGKACDLVFSYRFTDELEESNPVRVLNKTKENNGSE